MAGRASRDYLPSRLTSPNRQSSPLVTRPGTFWLLCFSIVSRTATVAVRSSSRSARGGAWPSDGGRNPHHAAFISTKDEREELVCAWASLSGPEAGALARFWPLLVAYCLELPRWSRRRCESTHLSAHMRRAGPICIATPVNDPLEALLAPTGCSSRRSGSGPPSAHRCPGRQSNRQGMGQRLGTPPFARRGRQGELLIEFSSPLNGGLSRCSRGATYQQVTHRQHPGSIQACPDQRLETLRQNAKSECPRASWSAEMAKKSSFVLLVTPQIRNINSPVLYPLFTHLPSSRISRRQYTRSTVKKVVALLDFHMLQLRLGAARVLPVRDAQELGELRTQQPST